MGNATSSDSPEEDNTWLGAVQRGEERGSGDESLTNFSCLFHPESLYKALLAIKESPSDALSRKRDDLIRWLSGLADKDESSVNMVQVVEHLTGKGLSQEEAIEFFNEIDREGEGQVDIAYLLMVLKDTSVDPMQALLPCHLKPGPLEVYLPNKCCNSNTGGKLVKFLQSKRVKPSSLVVGPMNQIISHQMTREKLVQGRYQALLQREEDGDITDDSEGIEGLDVSERVVVSKCYSKIETSSSTQQIKNLTDNRMDTCWQSNGPPRSHWIRLQILPGMIVKELSISVQSGDDSYMPSSVVVSVGNSDKRMMEIKTVKIPRDTNGSIVLVRSLAKSYQYLQISIKGCHSDGCDTKVHGLHVKGSKMVAEEKKPSVLDTIAVWYISLLTSTAHAAFPIAPRLRQTLLTHSRSALSDLQPLSLSPSSPLRPEFLSHFVIQEMENMLQTLSSPENDCDVTEYLDISLAFSIAHGNVNSILDCLYKLLDCKEVKLNVQTLLNSMEEMKRKKFNIHSEPLKLKVVNCNGGEKDNEHKPQNILTNDVSCTSAVPYISSVEKKSVAIVLEEKDGHVMSITRLVVQVPSSENAATSCLLFLLEEEEDEPDEKKRLESLETHKGWNKDEYSQWLEETEGKDGSGLIARVEFSKNSLVMDVVPDVARKGKSLIIVARRGERGGEEEEEEEGTKAVAVQALNVFGHCNTAKEEEDAKFLLSIDEKAPLATEGEVAGDVIFCRVLVFLSHLLQDLTRIMNLRRLASLEPSLISEPHLAVENVSLQKIWKLYLPLSSQPEDYYSALLVLWLLRAALPFIKPGQSVTRNETRDEATSSSILTHLCQLLDRGGGGGDKTTISLVQEIVVKGVVVFFPDAGTRRDYLLEMIGNVLSEQQPRSWWLKFEALCQYFSKTNTNSLLRLPNEIQQDGEVDTTSQALELMKTLLTVARRESQISLTSAKPRPENLVGLLCALQASLFFWCNKNISNHGVQSFLLKYIDSLITECVAVLKDINQLRNDHKEEKMKALQNSLLPRTLREMLIFLSTIVKTPLLRPRLMHTLYPLVPALQTAISSCPSTSLPLSEMEKQTEDRGDCVVGVWTRESSHNYENNSHFTEEFVCPSANKFVVEFDPRCITERRYDYLEFTDVTGAKKKFHSTLNSDNWPKTAEFPGPRLSFLFHSDGSNNEWGYRFTLKAFGQASPSLHWLQDLQLSLSRLLGQLVSVTLSVKTLAAPSEQLKEDQKTETLLTSSDLWRTLFRGGYMLGKLTRSLSGAHMANPATELNIRLHDMANGEEDTHTKLLDKLREAKKGPYYGGEKVDNAVNAVFAALIWHCQELRDEFTSFTHSTKPPSQLLREAFSTAEALRGELVETRQKVVEAREKEEDPEKKAEMNEDNPVISCRDKAMFLLKFAGLSRVKEEEQGEREDGAVNTVARLRQQLSLGGGGGGGGSGGQARPCKRPASFDLVLSFVRNEAITEKKIHSLLQDREKLASCVAQAYTFAASYLSAISTDVFDLPGLLFLQQLVSKQRHFPIHYAAKLDGCGLELENQVRKAYHFLLKQLLEGLAGFSRPPSVEYHRSRLLVSIITCHLLDFQWQNYDHLLLTDLQLSHFLLQSAIKSTLTEGKKKVEKFEGEDAILERYSFHMSLQEKDKEMGGNNPRGLEQLTIYQKNKWESELYVEAKHWSPNAGLQIQCDGCQSIVKDGVFYHNMDLKSTSFDLCPQCFTKGTGNRDSDHSSDQLYLAMGQFSCSQCKLYILSHRFRAPGVGDLCLGCFRKEEMKRSSCKWTIFPETEVPATSTSNRYTTTDPEHSKPLLYENGCVIETGPSLELLLYHQQHCWLLFISLCLSMAYCLHVTESDSQGQSYQKQAAQNLLQCLQQLAQILQTAVTSKMEEIEKGEKKMEEKEIKQEKKEEEEEKEEEVTESTSKPSDETITDGKSEEDPIITACRMKLGDNTITAKEKTFSLLFLSSSLYTLAALVPEETGSWREGWDEFEVTVREQLLPALLQVATCTSLGSTLCQLAYIVTSQYMARVHPQVADQSVAIARGCSPSQAAETGKGGLVTARYFFSLGASFLHRSDFSGAATIAECLLILSRASSWREVVSQSVLSPLTTKIEEMDLSSVFALMVLAGFPKLHREGSLVKVHSGDSEHQPSVSVLTSVNGDNGTVVTCEQREPQLVKLSQCVVEDTLQGCISISELPSLLPLLRSALNLAKQEDERQVETTWILSLILKAILALLKDHQSVEVAKTFLKEGGLLNEVSKLACKGTRLSTKWLASDLEVVVVRNYRPHGETEETGERDMEKVMKDMEEEEIEEDKGKDKEKKEENSRKDEEPCLEGLSEEIQDMLVIMQEAFQCSLPTLRALFDASGADVNKFIMSSEQYYDLESATLKPPPEIAEAATRWESEGKAEQRETKIIQDTLDDAGVTRLLPIPFSLSSLEAEPEKHEVMKKLKSSELMQQETSRPNGEGLGIVREESFQLLQDELKKSNNCRSQLLKTQQAIVVLYARQVLGALLTNWPHPPHPRLSTSELGGIDEMQFFCLLDLLLHPLSQEASSQLLLAVIHCLEPTQLVSLTVRAAEGMRSLSLGSETRKFQCGNHEKLEEKGKIVIPCSSRLSIAIQQDMAEIELASNEDMSDHHTTFNKSSSSTNTVHYIPGNTVYFVVRLEKKDGISSCVLNVTGTQMGRFTTGLRFLEQLLTKLESEDGKTMTSSISFCHIWPNLVAVACHYSGQDRLQVVCLLLRLLVVMKNCHFEGEKPDLSALKPLWQLYTTLGKEYENKNKPQQTIAPVILRSLTELFLTVETLAERWGVSQNMVVETLTKETLGRMLEKGICNVAYVSLGLDLHNTISSAFSEAKRCYVAPTEKEEEEEEEEEGVEEDHESEDEDEESGMSSSECESDNSFESEES